MINNMLSYFIFCLLLLGYLPFLLSLKVAPSSSNLLAVQMIFRHGDRTPRTVDTSYSVAQLTNEGKKELLKLGQYIRNRYDSFLGSEMLSSDLMQILSSDMDRTLDSAHLFAYGLFDHVQREPGWNDGKLQYEPFPVRSIPAGIDRYLQVTEPCPRFTNELFVESGPECFNYVNAGWPEFVEAYLKLKPYRSQTETLPLWAVTNIDICDLAEEVKYNITQNWRLSEMGETLNKFQILENYCHICQIAYLNTIEKLRLYSGSLLQTLLENFREKSPKKLSVFSAHDRTLYGQLMILGVVPRKPPATGSVLIYELHGSGMRTNGTFVKVFFKDGVKAELEEIYIEPCSQVYCDLRKFSNLMEKYIPDDYFQECQPKL